MNRNRRISCVTNHIQGTAFLPNVCMKADSPDKPDEVPVPGKSPETIPAPEPLPPNWPIKEPEIKPEKEPLTVPPSAPPEVPPQPH
jgi:hypothetical protein